jgi:DNA-binding response OmpR family regulator
MPRLLLVEGDPYMQRTFQKLFVSEEYFCAVAATSQEAREALEGDPFDLVVLHLGQQAAEGLALLRDIRTRHLVLAPQHDVMDTVLGLEQGADDYLCEPFDPRELRARVQAQLRRADGYSRPVANRQSFQLGAIVLNVAQRDAFRDGTPLSLTSREFELLHLLARHPGEPLASQWIFENVWGYAARFGFKALTVYIGRLRRKIEEDPEHPRLLISVRGFGYKLAA